ncbi:LOG family protein [Parachlamydia acanthamoebae]|uniref:LOG family protein n=1 Tax=Parachlamydia acanthamoebae TaxID=83552 RepID=UPI000751437E|nr:LOG family protein [Parachlamydia acanthamoebae]
MAKIDVNSPEILEEINHLLKLCDVDPETLDSSLIIQQIQNSLKLLHEGFDRGKLKLITRTFKEMRYAYRVFNQYPGKRRISIFGSARTPETNPNYQAAKAFSSELSKQGWMCMTGAANGIMKAGLEGAERGSSFGLSIQLPFESGANSVIEGDPKLISFRYFFTRKLMFMSHSDALSAFPGGFGTLDELFECLTLIQTGKANIIPIVLIEAPGGEYWKFWEFYVRDHLLEPHLISQEDMHLYFITTSVDDAVAHVLQFYKRYHSSRYVQDFFVIRMLTPIAEEYVEELNKKFSALVQSGKIEQRGPFPEEDEFLDLPRIVFHHTRRDMGMVRALIDKINLF